MHIPSMPIQQASWLQLPLQRPCGARMARGSPTGRQEAQPGSAGVCILLVEASNASHRGAGQPCGIPAGAGPGGAPLALALSRRRNLASGSERSSPGYSMASPHSRASPRGTSSSPSSSWSARCSSGGSTALHRNLIPRRLGGSASRWEEEVKAGRRRGAAGRGLCAMSSPSSPHKFLLWGFLALLCSPRPWLLASAL